MHSTSASAGQPSLDVRPELVDVNAMITVSRMKWWNLDNMLLVVPSVLALLLLLSMGLHASPCILRLKQPCSSGVSVTILYIHTKGTLGGSMIFSDAAMPGIS
jgi:hypothetical protein